jgi:hypothetical protein
MPRIAVTTGGGDKLECLLRRFGIPDSEFTNDLGTGRVHLYAGGDGSNSFAAGGTFAPATALWSSPTKLASYDMILLSCEGSTSRFVADKPQTSVDNLAAWANAGGRLFLSHLHVYWLRQRPDFSSTAAYVGNLDQIGEGTVFTVNQTFPKGMALAQWLAGPMVNASSVLGQIVLDSTDHSVTSVNPPTTEWIYLPSNPSNGQRSVQTLGFNTPVGTPEAAQCGKVLYTDVHLFNGSNPLDPFPNGCSTSSELSPRAKAMEFAFFDLASCI